MDKEKVIELLESAKYRFAKTAIRNPHWYTQIETWDKPEDFIPVAQFIRDNAKIEWFWRKKYYCFHYDGWKWWSMDDDINDTVLINKTKVFNASICSTHGLNKKDLEKIWNVKEYDNKFLLTKL